MHASCPAWGPSREVCMGAAGVSAPRTRASEGRAAADGERPMQKICDRCDLVATWCHPLKEPRHVVRSSQRSPPAHRDLRAAVSSGRELSGPYAGPLGARPIHHGAATAGRTADLVRCAAAGRACPARNGRDHLGPRAGLSRRRDRQRRGPWTRRSPDRYGRQARDLAALCTSSRSVALACTTCCCK